MTDQHSTTSTTADPTADPTEIRHEVTVDADVERTFWAFVDLDRIKPHAYNLLAVPIEATVVEHREGRARGAAWWASCRAFPAPRCANPTLVAT